MADPVQQRKKAEKRAQALRRNLSRRKEAARQATPQEPKESTPDGHK